MSEIPSLSAADMLKFDGMVEECVKSLQRIENEKSFQSDVKERSHDELGVPKQLVIDLANERHKEAMSKKQEKADEIINLNEKLKQAAFAARKQTQAPTGDEDED